LVSELFTINDKLFWAGARTLSSKKALGQNNSPKLKECFVKILLSIIGLF
jgi:hypothetical protein